MTLYSYCIPVDDGAAPNPFWGTCTLAICKPAIRRTAIEGDWIAATGSARYGFARKLVYAMKVTKKMTLEEYDKYCRVHLPNKIPQWDSRIPKLMVGDCIYDYSSGNPILRPSVHKPKNVDRDLRGKMVLLSDHFYYFGSKPEDIPEELEPIVLQGQGHKSTLNNNYRNVFVQWLTTKFDLFTNDAAALPYGLNDFLSDESAKSCSSRHCAEDDEDERLTALC